MAAPMGEAADQRRGDGLARAAAARVHGHGHLAALPGGRGRGRQVHGARGDPHRVAAARGAGSRDLPRPLNLGALLNGRASEGALLQAGQTLRPARAPGAQRVLEGGGDGDRGHHHRRPPHDGLLARGGHGVRPEPTLVVQPILAGDQAKRCAICLSLSRVVHAAHNAIHAAVKVLQDAVQGIAMPIAKVRHGREHQGVVRVRSVAVAPGAHVRDEARDAAAAVAARDEWQQVRAVAPLREALEVRTAAEDGIAAAELHPELDAGQDVDAAASQLPPGSLPRDAGTRRRRPSAAVAERGRRAAVERGQGRGLVHETPSAA
mmetsp:Transcript_133404/g.386155  ORF Transcript_133404/g.386155 Transcript_133404/m.386155 type:complete len:320 (-) Transcript_133404:27-986(-)